MSEFEKALRHVEMRKPSAGYFDRGLARIAAHEDRVRLVSAKWRYAAVGLAILLSTSMILNVVNWVGNGQGRSADGTLAFSVLRQEGEMMIYETGYMTEPGDSK